MKSKTSTSPSPNKPKKNNKSSYKKKADKVYLIGTITELLPGVKFKVKIERSKDLEPLILTCDTWSFFKSRVKMIKGDSVEVEIDPEDLSKGIVVARL